MRSKDKNNNEIPDCLKLDNQLCFPLYACAKAVTHRYRPLLEPFDLTYTQYITMMVLWEQKEINVKELGEKLYLDSGTLTPVLKKLESKNYISRHRSEQDERNLIVRLTDEGANLKNEIVTVPEQMSCCFDLTTEEATELYRLLHKIITSID